MLTDLTVVDNYPIRNRQDILGFQVYGFYSCIYDQGIRPLVLVFIKP
jgi:hypothetical protein